MTVVDKNKRRTVFKRKGSKNVVRIREKKTAFEKIVGTPKKIK